MTEHGIGDYATVAKYGLGYVADPLPGDEWFQGSLCIPYLNSGYNDDGVNGIKYRNLTGSGAKYKYPHGSKQRLYNARAFFVADSTVGVAEGEMDAIAASEHVLPSFGVPGVESWTKMERIWSPIFKDFQRVLIFAQGDQPSRDWANEVAEAVGWRAQIVRCPDGEDVASMVSAGRTEELRDKCQLASQ